MAHQADSSVIETVVQLLSENGLSHMADAMRLMLNEAMRIERSQVLAAERKRQSNPTMQDGKAVMKLEDERKASRSDSGAAEPGGS